jgi:hypothetical protein
MNAEASALKKPSKGAMNNRGDAGSQMEYISRDRWREQIVCDSKRSQDEKLRERRASDLCS